MHGDGIYDMYSFFVKKVYDIRLIFMQFLLSTLKTLKMENDIALQIAKCLSHSLTLSLSLSLYIYIYIKQIQMMFYLLVYNNYMATINLQILIYIGTALNFLYK